MIDLLEEGIQFRLSPQPSIRSSPTASSPTEMTTQTDSVLPSRLCHFFLEIALIPGPDLCGPWRMQSEVPPPRVDRMKRLRGAPLPHGWAGASSPHLGNTGPER